MRTIERVIGITLGTAVLAAGPALAKPAKHPSTIAWTTADAVAAERVPGNILDTTLTHHGARALYAVDIRTPGDRLEEVLVDARNARVVGVHTIEDPAVAGEVEAP
jgi:hypothetical protein